MAWSIFVCFLVCCSQNDKLSVYLTLVLMAIQDQGLMNFQALACFNLQVLLLVHMSYVLKIKSLGSYE